MSIQHRLNLTELNRENDDFVRIRKKREKLQKFIDATDQMEDLKYKI